MLTLFFLQLQNYIREYDADYALYAEAYNLAISGKTWTHPKYATPPSDEYEKNLQGQIVQRSWIPYQGGTAAGKKKEKKKKKPKPDDWVPPTLTAEQKIAVFSLHVVYKRLASPLEDIKDSRWARWKQRLEEKEAKDHGSGGQGSPTSTGAQAAAQQPSESGPALKGDDAPTPKDAPIRQLRKHLPRLAKKADSTGAVDLETVAEHTKKRSADGKAQKDPPRIRRPPIPRIPNLLPGPSAQKCHEHVSNTILSSLLIRFV
jgi:hypothetical protein